VVIVRWQLERESFYALARRPGKIGQMGNATISVIIPTYNRASLLALTL
jgi:hypothetical protein